MKKFSYLYVTAVAGFILHTVSFPCSGQSKWEVTNPLPCFGYLNSAVYAQGRIVAAGRHTGYSIDGTVWVADSQPSDDKALRGIAYGNGTFVAVGGNIKPVYWSKDGENWTNAEQASGIFLNSIAYGNGVFVAVGDEGGICSSPDGESWSVNIPFGKDRLINTIAFGNNRFVAGGYKYSNAYDSSIILISENGTDWTSHIDTAYEYPIYFDFSDGQFTAIFSSSIRTSQDGLVWKEVFSTYSILNAVTFADGIYVATGDSGLVLYSLDGGNRWSETRIRSNDDLNFVCFAGDQFVAFGESGTIITAKDPAEWIVRSHATTNNLNSVCFGNDMFLTVGDCGTILSSLDGKAWIAESSGTVSHLYSVTRSNDKFVAVGESGTIISSSNGIDWSDHSQPFIDGLTSVTWGNGLFVAVTNKGTVHTSEDGNTWTVQSFLPENSDGWFTSVAYLEGRFFLTGFNHDLTWGSFSISVSTDGVTWVTKHAGYYMEPSSISYGKGKFIVTGPGEAPFLFSEDAETWSAGSSLGWENLAATIYANNRFVTVGYGIFMSEDAEQWSLCQAGLDSYFYLTSVVFGKNTFVAVGRYGQILTSPVDIPAFVSGRTSSSERRFKLDAGVVKNSITVFLPAFLTNKNIQTDILSVSGKKIMSRTFRPLNGCVYVPVSEIPSGRYLVSVSDGKKKLFSSQVVIAR
jgi:hypothetical protein